MSETTCQVYVNGHMAFQDDDSVARDWARALILEHHYRLQGHSPPTDDTPRRTIELLSPTHFSERK